MDSRKPVAIADEAIFFSPASVPAAGVGGRSFAVMLVVALHVGLLALLAVAAVRPELVQPVTALAVRMLEAPPSTAPPKVEPIVKPAPAPVKATPQPVITTAKRNDAPANFAVAPQPEVAAAPAPAPAAAVPAPVTAARFDADYLQNPKPVYPPMSRRLGEEGKVVLRVRVSAQGGPISVEISQSSGYVRLDEAARSAVERWRFVPAKQGGEAIDSSVLVPLNFTLNN